MPLHYLLLLLAARSGCKLPIQQTNFGMCVVMHYTKIDSYWITSHFVHRYCLCKYNNFIGLSTLPQQSLLPKSSPASLNHNISASCPLVASQTCQWREVYKRAFTLKQNWKKGRYSLSPLLRGHSKPVTTITCEGQWLVTHD